jgi:hypothetical protein
VAAASLATTSTAAPGLRAAQTGDAKKRAQTGDAKKRAQTGDAKKW